MTRIFALVVAAVLAADAPDDKPVTNSIGMKLVRIPAGEFQMGLGAKPPTTRKEWDERDADEAPVHTVKIARPFLMGATEVTNAQYEQFDPEHKKLRGKFGITKGDDGRSRLSPGSRRPTSASGFRRKRASPIACRRGGMEFACRAGTTTPTTPDTLSRRSR